MIDLIKESRILQALLFLLMIIILTTIGFVTSARSYRRISRKISSLQEYRDAFISWCNSDCSDEQIYIQLVSQSPRIQSEVGGWGIMTVRPPFANYMINNWPVITNGIPEIHQDARRGLSYRINDTISAVDESLLRAIGFYSEIISNIKADLFNPIVLFRDGLSFLITLPVYVLAEFGLISHRAYSWIRSSIFVKSIAFLMATIGLVSAIIGIATGWKQFMEIIRPYLDSFTNW